MASGHRHHGIRLAARRAAAARVPRAAPRRARHHTLGRCSRPPCRGRSFVVGCARASSRCSAAAPRSAPSTSRVRLVPAGQFQLETRAARRPALDGLRAAHHLRRVADPRLLARLHGARPDKRRFFAYLNLFVAAMLLLVLADSYLLLYVGWEGVGLASYLLIGFWNQNPAYATAANKAFVVNRVGDFGLSIAIMLMFCHFGAVDFATVHAGAARGQPDGDDGHRPDAARSAPAASRRSSRCRPGSATPWPARHRCPRSSTRRRWSPPASTSSCARSAIFEAAPERPARRRHRRRHHAALRGDRRLRQGRHQEGARGLDDEPDRLHDARRGSRPGRLRVRDLPPAHPRLLQGRHVPRRRLGHARHERPGRHAPLRRAVRVP